jgi:tetratricopeptide (TPR) repeat protein
MGDKMAYRVALDSIPEGKSGQEGLMAVNWMKAAEQDGIPTAFIVDRQSRVAWIGHPMAMEEPLAKVVANKWDIEAEAVKLKKAQEAAHKMRELNTKIAPAYQQKDYAKVLSILDDAIAKDPGLEEQLSFFKFNVLLQADKSADAAEYGAKLVDGKLKDNAMALNQLSWGIVDPAAPKKDPALIDLALKAALRADELSKEKDPAIADTLGAAYYASGNIDKAIETQERALTLAKGTQFEKDPSLAQHLSMYKAAKK